MPQSRIKAIRARFEKDSGDLQGLVQLKMLGQGYDFPPITVVVPMRPYGSFARVLSVRRARHPRHHAPRADRARRAGEQFLDVIYHAELGIDEHIETIYVENDMDPATLHEIPADWQDADNDLPLPGTTGLDTATGPEAFVLFEQGAIESRIVHDQERVEQRRKERELEAMAQRYAKYAQTSAEPAHLRAVSRSHPVAQ